VTREEWLVQLGQALAVARKAARLTQGQVAERVGVHRQTVYRWEQGAQAPDVWHWAGLSELLPGLGLPVGSGRAAAS
jgi:DNA-binding XRE family transcriptional regulator